MTVPRLRFGLTLLVATLVLWAFSGSHAQTTTGESKGGEPMLVQFLEIVTPDVDGTCNALEKMHGTSFSKPEPMLGNARTAALEGGGMISVRAPMREDEHPVVRPYLLVDDIEAAFEAARAAGAELAHPPMEIPGRGKFAIYILGGIQHGLWQN